MNAHLEGKPIQFPEARLRTKLYELDDAYPGLLAKVRDEVDGLTLARCQPDGLGEASSPLSEYKADDLRADVERDAAALRGLRESVAGATIENDPKLEALSELLTRELGPEKAIIFSYYADTVYWIERALTADRERPRALRGPPPRGGDRRGRRQPRRAAATRAPVLPGHDGRGGGHRRGRA